MSDSIPILVSSLLGLAGALLGYFYQAKLTRQIQQQTELKIAQIEIKVAEQPEKIRFAWDLASTKLEAYFDRNLNQVKSIFWVAILVMIVGFGFIMYGMARSMTDPQAVQVAWVSATAGIVTEFIGASFMLIYRSTMQQAASFMHVLERINSVGMAVQIMHEGGSLLHGRAINEHK